MTVNPYVAMNEGPRAPHVQRYRFRFDTRQFKAGDLVPLEYDPGTVQTMLHRGRVERAEEEKQITRSPSDKMTRSTSMKHK